MELDRIETENLIGVRVQADDLALLYRMYTNDEVMYTMGGTKLFKEAKESHQRMMDHWETNGYGIYIFFLKTTGEFVGRGGLKKAVLENKEEVEVLCAIMPNYWNKGYATEIVKKSVVIAKEYLKLPSVVCFTLAENKRSQKVIEKSGFRQEKTFSHFGLPHILYRQ